MLFSCLDMFTTVAIFESVTSNFLNFIDINYAVNVTTFEQTQVA
jgi:hypothetical protein